MTAGSLTSRVIGAGPIVAAVGAAVGGGTIIR